MYDLMPFHKHTPLSLWDAFFDVTRPELYDMAFPIDIKEDEKEFVVTAELPGVKPEDVTVTLKDDLLTVKGEKKEAKSSNGDGCYCSERSYGSFSRTIRMPDNINYDSDVKATYQDGILAVGIPKRKAQESKQVKIAVT